MLEAFPALQHNFLNFQNLNLLLIIKHLLHQVMQKLDKFHQL